MTVRRAIVLLAGCLVAVTAMAGDPPQVQKAKLDQQLGHQGAQVQQLEKTVAAQEAKSQAAADRSRQQDATIAELQRELKAAQANKASRPAPTPQAGGH